ncbi:MAG: hypothetical protein K2W95_32900 [Candidatus Obscuribacterales bacterium]|nr:hypothetical protein [Candidatus Obscuribacterales bacterium]
MGQSVIITSVGVGNYQTTEYAFGAKTFTTQYAPVALAHMKGLGGWQCLLLATEEAIEMHAPAFRTQMEELAIDTTVLLIPKGKNEADLMSIVDSVIKNVSERSTAILEVTNALRHLPFVYLASLSYLVGLHDVNIEGIYYGAWELREDQGPAPILDVTSLFSLIEWYHALRKARDTGDLRGISHQLLDAKNKMFRKQESVGGLLNVCNATKEMSEVLAAGLPVEVGLTVARLSSSIDTYLSAPVGDPSVQLAVSSLRETITQWSVTTGLSSAKQKKDLPLSYEELERQLLLCEWYANKQDIPKSLQIAREWLVSYSFLQSGKTGMWLDYKARSPAEQTLKSIAYRNEHNIPQSEELKNVGNIWSKLSQLRNSYAHVGMTNDRVNVSKEQLTALLSELKKLLNTRISLSDSSRSATWLVTPMGLSPGVLYSALSHIRPEGVLVVTSPEAENSISEAISRANCPNLEVLTYVMKEPFYGFGEAKQVLSMARLSNLLSAKELVTNITGGTTAMQHVVERVAEDCRHLGMQVRTIALIDKRAVQEQRSDPWQRGELYALDQGNQVQDPALV